MSDRSRRAVGAFCLLTLAAGARAATYSLPESGDDLIGEERSVEARAGDTIATLAHQNSVGFRQVLYANPALDPWNLKPGQAVRLPTQMLLPPGERKGIVINVPEMRLFYFPEGGKQVSVYPVAVGRVDWPTPLGETQVRMKVRNPVWNVPESIRREHAAQGDPLPAQVAAGSPDNPLGLLALRLGWPEVLIHGTNMPLGGIGMPVTHGCIRLYPEDIAELFEKVAVGTPVRVIDEPTKLGRHEGRWYLEAHPPLKESPVAATDADVAPSLVKIKGSAAGKRDTLDWDRVAAALRKTNGAPVLVEAPPARLAPAVTNAPRPPPAKIAAAETRRSTRTEAGLLPLGTLVVLGLAGLVSRRRRLHR